MLYPKHVILATGAMERPVPFEGWTLPGVMTVGAAQTLLKSSGFCLGDVVLAGTGPPFYYANQIRDLGVTPQAILDTGPLLTARSGLLGLSALLACPKSMLQGVRWFWSAKRELGLIRGVRRLKAHGKDRLSSVTYDAHGHEHELSTSLLLVHDGVIRTPGFQCQRHSSSL